MLERQHLQQLEKIEELGSVTKAAKALFVTQSALSHSIKKLENNLGIQIWRKSGRNLVLTDAGKRLLRGAQKILPQFEKLEQDVQAMASGQGGEIKLGIECYPCFQWLLKIVGPFLKAYPEVDVDIKNEFQFGGLGALLNYEIDMLLTPDPLHHSRIDYLPVFEYEQVLLVNSDSPLAEKSFVEPKDLQNQTLFTFPVEASRLDIFSRFLTPSGFGVKHHKTLENAEMMVQMVESNRGVAALPDWLLNEIKEAESLKQLQIGQTGIHKTSYIGIRAEEQDHITLSSFLNYAMPNN